MRPVDILQEMVAKVGTDPKVCSHCFKTEKGGMHGCLVVFTGVQTSDPCLKAQWDECPANPLASENIKAKKKEA